MSFVVLIFGTSGSGKSTLLELLTKAGRQYSIQMKGTDRQPRQYDGIEIRCVPQVTPDQYDYIYHTYGARYGIQKSQIDDALGNNQHHFIICNDIPTIRAIKRDYGNKVKVVFHYFDAPRKTLLEIQKARNISDDEINLRITKIDALYRTFVEEWSLFDATLYNRFGHNTAEMQTEMEKLLADFASDEMRTQVTSKTIEKLVEVVAKQIAERRTRVPMAQVQNYAFVIMAMFTNDPGQEDVHNTIKRTCKEVGITAERVDDIDFTGQITEKILASIEMASLVIADVTHERPNVYYEVGYAEALYKPILLIAREGTKLHFDLQGMRVEFYRNMTQLEQTLQHMVPTLIKKAETEKL